MSNQIGTFEEAVQFRLKMQLKSTPAERLQDLEDMWDFTTAVWEKNPEVFKKTQKLWELQRIQYPR